MHALRRVGAVTIVAAGAFGCAMLGATPAAAASCRVITVDNAVPVGITLSPSHVSVAYGGCVAFTDNAFGPPVTVKVGKHYSATLNYGESTSAKTSYQATEPGQQQVTADGGTASAKGSITVGSPPASPTPTPAPSHSPAPSTQPTPGASSTSSGPQVAASPHRSHRAGPPAVIPTNLPPVSPGFSPTTVPTPSVAGSPSPKSAGAVVAGPLEPPGDRNIGLPASLAALALVGVGAALVRVLLAEPIRAVDNPQTVSSNA